MTYSVYDDNAPCRTSIYYWIGEFRNGRTKVDDDTKPETPAEFGDFHEEKLLQIVREERGIGCSSEHQQKISVQYHEESGNAVCIMQYRIHRSTTDEGVIKPSQPHCCMLAFQLWKLWNGKLEWLLFFWHR